MVFEPDRENLAPGVDREQPGLDLQDWETRYEQLAPDLEDDPRAALPELADLVEEILNERGFVLDEDVAPEGESPDVVREYRSAREVSDQLERGEEVDPGDVANAVNGLRELYAHVTTSRPE